MKEIFLEKQKANILRILYADNYDIISEFNPRLFDTLKEEVDEYKKIEEEEEEEEEKQLTPD